LGFLSAGCFIQPQAPLSQEIPIMLDADLALAFMLGGL
jgi:hypothetical protein